MNSELPAKIVSTQKFIDVICNALSSACINFAHYKQLVLPDIDEREVERAVHEKVKNLLHESHRDNQFACHKGQIVFANPNNLKLVLLKIGIEFKVNILLDNIPLGAREHNIDFHIESEGENLKGRTEESFLFLYQQLDFGEEISRGGTFLHRNESTETLPFDFELDCPQINEVSSNSEWGNDQKWENGNIEKEEQVSEISSAGDLTKLSENAVKCKSENEKGKEKQRKRKIAPDEKTTVHVHADIPTKKIRVNKKDRKQQQNKKPNTGNKNKKSEPQPSTSSCSQSVAVSTSSSSEDEGDEDRRVRKTGCRIEGSSTKDFLKHIDEHTADTIRDNIHIFQANIPKIENTLKALISFTHTLKKVLMKIPYQLDPDTNEVLVRCKGCHLHCLNFWNLPCAKGRPAAENCATVEK